MFKKTAVIFAAVLFCFCFYSLYAFKKPVFGAYAKEFELYLSNGSFGSNIVRAVDKNYGSFGGIKGESCFVNVSYGQVLEDFSAAHVFSEENEYGISYYAYSPALKYKVYLNGRAVNIHYHVGEKKIKLGTPMIFGAY
ncbi:MAG: hypothetical protein J6Y43_04800 [Clostridia bacterium]|nr:hypothetical protein [Clostridia bacterium]